MSKSAIEKIKYDNLKIQDVYGDDTTFTIKVDGYEISFDIYDIDNDYDLRSRVIYKMDCFKMENNQCILSLLIWLENDHLLEKVVISCKSITIKKYKKDKLVKEEKVWF